MHYYEVLVVQAVLVIDVKPDTGPTHDEVHHLQGHVGEYLLEVEGDRGYLHAVITRHYRGPTVHIGPTEVCLIFYLLFLDLDGDDILVGFHERRFIYLHE